MAQLGRAKPSTAFHVIMSTVVLLRWPQSPRGGSSVRVVMDRSYPYAGVGFVLYVPSGNSTISAVVPKLSCLRKGSVE